MSDSSATSVLRQDTLEVFGSPSYWVKGTYIGWILGTALWAGQSTSHLSYSLIYSSVFEIRSQYIVQARSDDPPASDSQVLGLQAHADKPV